MNNPLIPKKGILLFFLGMFLGIHSKALSRPPVDTIHLRNGNILEGAVTVNRDRYILRDLHTRKMTTLAKEDVRFVIYNPSAHSLQNTLNLRPIQKYLDDNSHAPVQFLPTEAFGQKLVEVAQSATTSISILAYYLSGSNRDPIATFYRTLQNKSKEGVDVTIIAPFDSGTEATVKETTMNFVDDLRRSGIKVRYLQGRKVQHKKLIIIDHKTVLLGSSNLTAAGVRKNNEMNILVQHPEFVREAIMDFQEILGKSLSAEELIY